MSNSQCFEFSKSYALSLTELFLPFISFDSSIILETDASTIASRVSRPRPDATELQINEQTIMNAYSNLKERVAQRILQGGL